MPTESLEPSSHALRTISPEEVAALRARPQFQDAVALGARSAIEHVPADLTFHRAMSDVGTMLLGIIALYLHYTTGLSHRQLRNLGGTGSLVSAGRATAILWRLQHLGYVQACTEYRKGEVRLYQPTDSLIAAFRARSIAEARSAGLLDPICLTMAAQYTDEVFQRLMIEQGHMILAAARQPNSFVAPLNALSMKTSGMMIIYTLIDSAFAQGAGRACGSAEFSAVAAARRFGVSRTHIARFLREMEAADYIERTENQNRVILTEVFAEVYETYFSFGQIAFARSCRIALAGAH